MYSNEEIESLKKSYQKLFEIATGTFRNSIQLDQYNEVDIQLLNLENTLKKWIEEKGYILPLFTWQGLTLFTLLINSKGIIVNSSRNTTQILEIDTSKLKQKPLKKILTPQSKTIWDITVEDCMKYPEEQFTIPLHFICNNNKLIHFICTVEKLNEQNLICVNALSAKIIEFENIPKLPVKRGKEYEKELVNKVCNYILHNRTESIPSTKILAKKFETNEYTLKAAFRNQLQTSIYKFFTNERLKQANDAIVQTKVPLKEIAFSFGFNDYTNFFKAFRKKFGYRPSDLKRPE